MEREIDSFGILYTGYLLSIVNIKKEREGEKERLERASKLSLVVSDKKCDKKLSAWCDKQLSPKVNRQNCRNL